VTLTEDESLNILSLRIQAKIPTSFFRFGDGQIQAILGCSGNNCDGELYTKELGENLHRVAKDALQNEKAFVGDYGAIIEREKAPYMDEWNHLSKDRKAMLIHYECPLLMRKSAALLNFYKTIKEDKRKKAFLGPIQNIDATKILDAEYIEYPRHYKYLSEIDNILKDKDFDVLISGAGMGSAIPIYDDWVKHPERTYINVGSAFDPVFSGHTRSYQLDMKQARDFFSELL